MQATDAEDGHLHLINECKLCKIPCVSAPSECNEKSQNILQLVSNLLISYHSVEQLYRNLSPCHWPEAEIQSGQVTNSLLG